MPKCPKLPSIINDKNMLLNNAQTPEARIEIQK
jgi:hypothetical protein